MYYVITAITITANSVLNVWHISSPTVPKEFRLGRWWSLGWKDSPGNPHPRPQRRRADRPSSDDRDPFTARIKVDFADFTLLLRNVLQWSNGKPTSPVTQSSW